MPAPRPRAQLPQPVATDSALATDSAAALRALLDELPEGLATQVFTHSSWVPTRAGSYERLAFLGDSVLSLAITSHLYPRLAAEEFGAGDLTKLRAQTVSGRSCRAVAERLGVPERMLAAAPPAVASTVPALTGTERVLASVIEAVIGACYLEFGYERIAQAVVAAFAPELTEALANPVDFKSALQERLARRAEVVAYEVVAQDGPPHDRTFTITALLGADEIGRGRGRSKKDAEQAAAKAALEKLDGRGAACI